MTLDVARSLGKGLSIKQQQEQMAEQQAQTQRLNQVRELQQSIANSTGAIDPMFDQNIQQLSGLDPNAARQTLAAFNTLSDGRKKAFFNDAESGLNMLNKGDFQGVMELVNDRRQQLQQIGGDTTDTDSIASALQNGDIQGAKTQLEQAVFTGQQQGFLKDPERQRASREIQKTANARDWDTFQSLIASGDNEKAKQFGRKAGFIRPSEQESSDIKVSETERKAVAKANVKRKQGFIDSGIEAANGAANIRRALTLLDEVPTGGFDNLALKAKRLFGIEGANEGELSNLMGKAVLAQLKPIFGAAFTAREGDALAELEAKFSNSAANNKRLLENALKLADRAARRGIAAAEDQDAEFTANEIRQALAFDLQEKAEQPTTEAPLGQVFNSSVLGRQISEQDILDTLQANPGLTREQLLQQLGVN